MGNKMMTNFVLIEAEQEDDSSKFLVQTDSIAFATAAVIRQNPDVWITNARIVEINGIILTRQPDTISENQDDKSSDSEKAAPSTAADDESSKESDYPKLAE